MLQQRLTGPIGVNIFESEDAMGEGARSIIIEPSPNVRVELAPIPAEICRIIAEALLASDDELRSRIEQEQREAQARSALHLPEGVRNGDGP